MEIQKGMSLLTQAGKIANDRLKLHHAKFGYSPVPRTPSLWKHARKSITSALVLENFGVKHVGKQHAENFIQVLQKLYTISIHLTGTLFCGLPIDWGYENRTCDISMPQYLKEAQHKS